MSVARSAFSVERSSSPARAGATLLVTLGVLAVLSVMVVTFLLTMRHQRLSAKHFSDKTVARQALDTALIRAMQFADGAMLMSNFVSQSSTPLSAAEQRQRRTYPVGVWYSRDYQPDPEARITDEVDYQTQEVLMVPVVEEQGAASFATNSLTVNLLTEEVRRLLPGAVTNRLGGSERLRSGWVDLENGSRISFAIINCSGLLDAHTYDFENTLINPATQSYERAYYSQQDLVNDRSEEATTEEKKDELDHVATLSYDPGPYTIPLARNSASVHPYLGYRDFSATNKFNINALTNHFDTSADPEYARVRVTQSFEAKWLNVVSNALNDAQRNTGGADLGDSGKIAWNIAAYMSPSRVPMISFPGIALASRADFGIESVPLVNEVCVFKCIDENGNCEDMFRDAIDKITQELTVAYTPQDATYTLAPIVVSNAYAAAAELWYPFVPRPIYDEARPDEIRLYLGVYTNRGDITTTTNSQWSAGDLADFYDLDDPAVAELEANILNDLYEDDPAFVTNSLFWSLVETNALVVGVIQQPDTLTETNLLDFSTGLATGYVGVYTDPATGLIATNNPYADFIYDYAPAPTNMTPEEVTNYYATASNYIPVLVTVLTSRVEDVTYYEGGGYSDNFQTILQRYLPASKIQVGPFGQMWTPEEPLRNEDFNVHGFCAVTNNRDLICFPVLQPPEAGETVYRVAFLPLGKPGKAWVRPVVAVKEPGTFGLPENDGFEPVDEALLFREKSGVEGENISVLEWPPAETATEATATALPDLWSLSVADPRDNAWAAADPANGERDVWYPAPLTFGTVNRHLSSSSDLDSADAGGADGDTEVSGASDDIPGVAELPFIHFDSPLHSVGELGYVTADIHPDVKTRNRQTLPADRHLRDTIDFSTRAGAAVLDRFTTAPTNSPMRGLVQANTTYPSVIRRLMDRTALGWTNELDTASHLAELNDLNGSLPAMVENWTNALLKTFDVTWEKDRNGLPGWRCFADMLPDLSTNAARHAESVLKALDPDNTFYRHDYVEDVMRGIVDYVSFRQNIFVVVVAAQAISPASTASSPVVLSEQRAAVTVLRDAFTGRWIVYNWVWLTD